MSYIEYGIGDRIRDFVEVKEIIDTGGFGRIYKGFCRKRHLNVIIKTFNRKQWEAEGLEDAWRARGELFVTDSMQYDEMSPGEYLLYTFFREARCLCQATGHPGLLQGYDLWWEANGQPFLECEYFTSHPLDAPELLKRLRPMGALQLTHIGLQICNAMLFVTKQMLERYNTIHRAAATGFIHRDIKPGNILLNTENQIKLIDFGTAKFIDHDNNATVKVGAGFQVRSMYYSSPEQFSGHYEMLEPASDVFSTGAVLYMLSGGDYRQIYMMSQRGVVEYPGHLPKEFRAILDTCLKYMPAFRYSDFDALRKALREFVFQVKEGMVDLVDSVYCGRCGFILPEGSIAAGAIEAGIQFARVEAGYFTKGCSVEQMHRLAAIVGENPYESELAHQVYVEEFEIGTYPVTNGQYLEFVKKTDYPRLPSHWKPGAAGSSLPFDRDLMDHPVVNVSWHDAVAYCKWAGCRLPTGDEWEKAARGTDGRLYPWGERYDRTVCNSAESGPGGTSAAGSYPGGKSPYGCMDMVGNVLEWVDEPHPESESFQYVRGGCWAVSCEVLGPPFFHYLALQKDAVEVGEQADVIGFRCARTPRKENSENSAVTHVRKRGDKVCPLCGRGRMVSFSHREIKVPENNYFTWRGFFDL